MRINGNIIEKLEQGTLDKETLLELLENEELGSYAWGRREILKSDPRLFFVFEEGAKFEAIDKIEQKYDARFVEGYTKNEKQIYLLQSLKGM